MSILGSRDGRRAAWACALLGLACRAQTPTPPASAAADASAETTPTVSSAQPHTTAEASGVEPQTTSVAPEASGAQPHATTAERPTPPRLDPAPPDADPCERSCGTVNGCLLALERTTPSAAASVEVACLDVCLERTPRPGDPFACTPPVEDHGAAELLTSCELYLKCVEDAWTEPQLRPPMATPIPTSGRGCERACQAFGQCRGLGSDSLDREAIDQCVELCSEGLDAEQERQAGACTELDSCDEIERCIRAIPGS